LGVVVVVGEILGPFILFLVFDYKDQITGPVLLAFFPSQN
jgi:hypothetical protein